MPTPEQCDLQRFGLERCIGQPALEAIKRLVLPNPEVAKVRFLVYEPIDPATPEQIGTDSEGREPPFWLTKTEIATGELDKIARQLPQNKVFALAGYVTLGEITSLPQPEISFGNGSCYYGLMPMIDYECRASAENLTRIKEDLIERLAERFGVIVYTGKSYHYIGGCLITHWLDIASFCGAQLQLNFPGEGVLMTDQRNIGHELGTRVRPKGELVFMEDVPVTETHTDEYRLNFILRSTAGGPKPFEPKVVDVIYRPPISFLRVVSE